MRVITNWVYEWVKNGWLDSNGQPVNIKEEVEAVHQQVRFFENRGVIVKFWKLDDALNKDARLLAESAINIMAMEWFQVAEDDVKEKISNVDRKRKQIDVEREKLEEQRRKIEFEKEAMRESKHTQLRLEKEWKQLDENEQIKVEQKDFEMLFGEHYQVWDFQDVRRLADA